MFVGASANNKNKKIPYTRGASYGYYAKIVFKLSGSECSKTFLILSIKLRARKQGNYNSTGLFFLVCMIFVGFISGSSMSSILGVKSS